MSWWQNIIFAVVAGIGHAGLQGLGALSLNPPRFMGWKGNLLCFAAGVLMWFGVAKLFECTCH